MTKPILMTSPGSHHCRRVTMLIHELEMDVDLQHVDVRPPGMGGENESPEFLALNPNGKVPVLRDGDFVLTESNAIMIHLCENFGVSSFWPEDRRERVLIQQWQFWQAAHLSPTADGFLVENMAKPMMGEQPNAVAIAQLADSFRRFANILDGALQSAEYLVADRLTCADLAVATALMYAPSAKIPVDEHPSVVAWLERIHARPSWKATEPPPMKM